MLGPLFAQWKSYNLHNIDISVTVYVDFYVDFFFLTY
jgi:hypothetical protein